MDNTMNVNFVSQGGVKLASHRMRVMKPATLLNVGIEGLNATITTKTALNADINIYGKHFDTEGNLKHVGEGEKHGYYSVFDVCDDHFDREHGKYYIEMCAKADVITCNSKNMQERILEVTGENSIVIPDPVSFPNKEFSKRGEGAAPHLLWYGHGTNAQSLYSWLDFVPDKVLAFSDATLHHPKIIFKKWKPNLVEKFLDEADIILIPTQKEIHSKCKSPNRAVDAINAGKFVITDNREIYGDLEEFLYIIDEPADLSIALAYWQKNQEEVAEKIIKGQDFIENTYSDDIILDKWLEVFKKLELVEMISNED